MTKAKKTLIIVSVICVVAAIILAEIITRPSPIMGPGPEKRYFRSLVQGETVSDIYGNTMTLDRVEISDKVIL